MSKNKSKTNREPAPMVRLRESVKAALAALENVLDAVSAVCDEAAAPKTPAGQATPKPQTSAPKPVKPARPEKPAKQAKTPAKPQTSVAKPARQPVKKQAEKPTTDDQAGRPGNATGAGTAPEKQVKRASASVRLTPHELTLNIGAQPVRELAEQDAKDLLNNPKVFWYRPIQFPDPKRYQVQPRIESARVVERKAAKFSRSPWTVNVTITTIGDDRRCEAWLSGVLAKNRGEQE